MAARDFSECRPSPTSSVGVSNVSNWNIVASSPQRAGPMQMTLGAPVRVPPTVNWKFLSIRSSEHRRRSDV